jgi:hypothetical protein
MTRPRIGSTSGIMCRYRKGSWARMARGGRVIVADCLPQDQVMATLARIAARFPGALVAFDTYPKRSFEQQHRLAASKGIAARWAWSCDDPRSLERTGLEVRQSATITRPPRAMRAQLPFRYRHMIPLVDPILGRVMAVTLFRASSPAGAGPDATARAAGAG